MRRSRLEVAGLLALALLLTAAPSVSAFSTLQGFDRLDEIAGNAICGITDNYGYVWTLEVEEETGDTTGIVDNAFPAGTSVSGLASNSFLDLTALNQVSDGCSYVHDFFVVQAVCSGNDCNGIIEAHCFSRFLYSLHWEGVFSTPCQSTLLFADGFESGSMSAWSSAAP